MIGQPWASGRSRRLCSLLLPGFLVVLMACGTSTQRDDRVPADQAYLLDADAAGAIAWDPMSRTYLGIRTDGYVQWRHADESGDALDIRCAGQCPSAMIANLADNTGQWIPDAATENRIDARPLWSSSPNGDHILYREDDQGAARVSMPSQSISVRKGRAFLALDTHKTFGLALVAAASPPGADLILLKRTATTDWTVLNQRKVTEAMTACVAENGDSYAVTSTAGVTISRAGTDKFFPFPNAGWCALLEGMMIAVRFASESGNNSTTLAVFDTNSGLRWKRTIPGLVRIRSRSGLVVVTRPEQHELLRLSNGSPLAASGLAEAHDALFISQTELVTVRPGGPDGVQLHRVRVR